MWGDERFRALTPMAPSGQALFVFLITGPFTSQVPGLIRAGLGALADELRWPSKALAKAFREIADQRMAFADLDARLIYLPNALKHNPPGNPNVIKSWASELAVLPECALKRQALAAMRPQIVSMGEGFAKAFDEVCAKALPKASPNQEQEAGTGEQEQLFASGDASAPGFELAGSSPPTDRGSVSDGVTPGARVWTAYSEAYRERYGAFPLRDAKVNSILATFADKIPAGEAPAVAAWYVRSSEAFYVRRKHPIDVMLRDATKLNTEWETGRHGSETEARQGDRTASRHAAAAELIEEARNAA